MKSKLQEWKEMETEKAFHYLDPQALYELNDDISTIVQGNVLVLRRLLIVRKLPQLRCRSVDFVVLQVEDGIDLGKFLFCYCTKKTVRTII